MSILRNGYVPIRGQKILLVGIDCTNRQVLDRSLKRRHELPVSAVRDSVPPLLRMADCFACGPRHVGAGWLMAAILFGDWPANGHPRPGCQGQESRRGRPPAGSPSWSAPPCKLVCLFSAAYDPVDASADEKRGEARTDDGTWGGPT